MVSQNVDTNKALIDNTIDAIAVIGHTVGELSNLRKEQVRQALRPEFHSLCKKPTIPHTLHCFSGKTSPKECKVQKKHALSVPP